MAGTAWAEYGKGLAMADQLEIVGIGMSVLDVGCGCGHILPSLRKIDPKMDYHGIDFSEEMLSEARTLFPKKYF